MDSDKIPSLDNPIQIMLFPYLLQFHHSTERYAAEIHF